MSSGPPVLYFAPGSGLGHLNRALAVCSALRELGVEAEIATNSPFAEGLARLARIRIVQIANDAWTEAAPAYLRERNPRLAVIDTFPFGLRGEWTDWPAGIPAVYLARRLNLPVYLQAIDVAGDWAHFKHAIVIEPLAADHDQFLDLATIPVTRLPGPIRLPPGTIATPVSRELDRLLDTGRLTLVIHGGPLDEVERLCSIAKEHLKPQEYLAAITPWLTPGLGVPAFEHYPAANLLHRAAHVVSGAGYNMMSDMLDLRSRHTAVGFPRRFDDQEARTESWFPVPADGTNLAARLIRDILRSFPSETI